MVRELAPIDIRHALDFAALVEEVWATGKARRIVRNGQELAVLMPATEAPRHRRPPSAAGKRQRGDRRSVTDQTAGALKAYRLPRPLTPDEEREAFETGVAEQVMESMER